MPITNKLIHFDFNGMYHWWMDNLTLSLFFNNSNTMMEAELRIRGGAEYNSKIMFLILKKKQHML